MKTLYSKLTIIALHLILIAPAYSQQHPDLKEEGLRGPVHTVSTRSSETLSIDEHEGDTRDEQGDSLTFDAQGRLITRIVYEMGLLLGTAHHSHDEAGNLVRTEFRDSAGKLVDKQTSKFANGSLIEQINLDEKGSVGLRDLFIYDRNGRLAEQKHYASRQLLGKTVFNTDAKGNITEATFFLADGRKAVADVGPCYSAHRVKYVYEGGRVTAEIVYNADGSVKRRSSYTYDDKGNVAEELRVDFFSTLRFVHAYDYDQYGNWTRQVIDVHTSRLPLYGDKRDESRRHIVRQRNITYYSPSAHFSAHTNYSAQSFSASPPHARIRRKNNQIVRKQRLISTRREIVLRSLSALITIDGDFSRALPKSSSRSKSVADNENSDLVIWKFAVVLIRAGNS